jgi:hypothetical protein
MSQFVGQLIGFLQPVRERRLDLIAMRDVNDVVTSDSLPSLPEVANQSQRLGNRAREIHHA